MNDGQILRRTTLLAADRSDIARLQLTAAGLLVAVDDAGAALPINNLGAPASLPMASILALSPAANTGVTIDASDYSYTPMYCDGTRWRPKGGAIPLLDRARGDVDLHTATGTASLDVLTYAVPAWVLELSTQVRVEVKFSASTDDAQSGGVRENAMQLLIDGTSTIAPGVAATASGQVTECSISNSLNSKTTQTQTRNGSSRSGRGQTTDVALPLTISNRIWNIVVRFLNAGSASNTTRLNWITIKAYVG